MNERKTRRYIRVGPKGARYVRLTTIPPDPKEGWVEVPQALVNEVVRDPRRVGVDARGRVRKMPRVRISVSRDDFDADGIDEVMVMVIAIDREADALGKIAVDVNGTTVEVPVNTPFPIKSTRPGVFRVRISDRRVSVIRDIERRVVARAGGQP